MNIYSLVAAHPQEFHFRAENPEAWEHFARRMACRQYGLEKSKDAWEWFLLGWVCGAEPEQLALLQAALRRLSHTMGNPALIVKGNQTMETALVDEARRRLTPPVYEPRRCTYFFPLTDGQPSAKQCARVEGHDGSHAYS